MGKMKTGLGIALLTLLTVGSVTGGYLFVSSAQRSFMEAEADMPESAISTYLGQIKKADYSGIYENSLIVAPHYNSREDYVAKLEEIYQDVDTSKIRYHDQSTDTETRYALVLDGKYLASVKLVQSTDGKWIASTEFSGNQNYILEVPTGETVVVNDIELSREQMIEEGVVASNFSGLKNTNDAPHVDKYELNNLLGEPKIALQSGEETTTLKDVITGHLFMGKPADNADYANVFSSAAKTVASFPAKEGNLASVGAITIQASEFYERIATMQNQWFSDHHTSNFSNMNVRNIIQQSEDTMVGYVTFDYYAANSEVNRTWNAGYQITFMKVNGDWKIAGFGVDSLLNPNKKVNWRKS